MAFASGRILAQGRPHAPLPTDEQCAASATLRDGELSRVDSQSLARATVPACGSDGARAFTQPLIAMNVLKSHSTLAQMLRRRPHIVGVPYCTQARVPDILADIRRHEGVGLAPNSHLGIFNSHFRTSLTKWEFERLVFPFSQVGDDAKFRRAITGRIQELIEDLENELRLFELEDWLSRTQRLQCVIDYYRHNP